MEKHIKKLCTNEKCKIYKTNRKRPVQNVENQFFVVLSIRKNHSLTRQRLRYRVCKTKNLYIILQYVIGRHISVKYFTA